MAPSNVDDPDPFDGPTIPAQGGDESRLLASRYKVRRKLGEGGMGQVYLAEDTELEDAKVAIKFIPPALANNARAIKSLKKEAETTKRLSHPNIVRLHDLHTDGCQYFLVMEHVEGKSLEEILGERDEGVLMLEELLPIAEQVAAALDYAHENHVLHQDLKPSNIMLQDDGAVKLLDFGVAREIKDSYTRLTGHETAGTLPYMSPEQLRGRAPAPSMDIYSFAAVLYECLCGHPPFHTGDLRHQILEEQPEALPNVAHSVNEALLSGLSKEPDNRPGTATALIEQSKRTAPQQTHSVRRRTTSKKASVARNETRRENLVVADVPEWTSWYANKNTWSQDRLAGAYVGGLLCAGFLLPVCAIVASGAGIAVGSLCLLTVLLVAAIAPLAHLVHVVSLRNRYRMECAGACLKQGDYIGGMSFCLGISKWGVDRTAAQRIVVQLAQVAMANGDSASATMLYRRGSEYWGSPHARRALRELKT